MSWPRRRPEDVLEGLRRPGTRELAEEPRDQPLPWWLVEARRGPSDEDGDLLKGFPTRVKTLGQEWGLPECGQTSSVVTLTVAVQGLLNVPHHRSHDSLGALPPRRGGPARRGGGPRWRSLASGSRARLRPPLRRPLLPRGGEGKISSDPYPILYRGDIFCRPCRLCAYWTRLEQYKGRKLRSVIRTQSVLKRILPITSIQF